MILPLSKYSSILSFLYLSSVLLYGKRIADIQLKWFPMVDYSPLRRGCGSVGRAVASNSRPTVRIQ